MDINDEQLARQNIFGDKPSQEPEVEVLDEQPEEEPAAEPVAEQAAEPVAEVPAETAAEVDLSNIADDKVIALINTKFNTKFDTIEDAGDYFSTQVSYRGQEEIIKQLAEKLKESNNVLSHFPNEQMYKVATLAKSEFPGKEATLSKILNSDIAQISDFEAIRLAEELKRPANSRVNALDFKLAKLGLRDLDVSDFDEWSDMDKQIVWGEAEDAKEYLKTLDTKVTVPTNGDAGVSDFVSQIERGVQENQEKLTQLTELYQPVAESLVGNVVKINPVEGSDFQYDITLDKESRQELIDFLTAEAIEGDYNIKSDDDIRRLNRMLHSEIWATENTKIMSAYKDYVSEKVWDEARKKYENATPLDESTPPVKASDGRVTDEDRARRILGR